MPLLRLLALLSFGTPFAWALPGEKLPDQFPGLSAQALVTSAVTTPEGSTFLMGNFTDADGITRPGLAKLTPSGHLDHTFAPPNFSYSDLTANPSIFYLGVNTEPLTHEPLFPLQRGGLIISGQDQWELRNPDGTLNSTLLSQFPRQNSTPPRPQFEKDGRLFLLTRNEGFPKGLSPFARLTTYHSDTLLPNPTFTLPANLPSPPLQASPAADGKIWILGRNFHPGGSPGHFSNPPAHTLYRLLPDGSLDPDFAPENLSASHTFSLVSNPGPGLQIASTWPGRYRFWPSALFESITFETRNQDGVSTRISSGSFNFGLSSFSHLLPDGQLLSQSLDNGDLVIRDSTTNEISFRLPFNTPDAPPETRTVTQFPDGKFLVGGNRRFLANGTPDPDWHTPRLSRPASIKHLIPLQDNTVLAVGDFDLASGLARSGAIKLNPDTTFNPSFSPGLDIRNARKILLKRNGNLIVLLNNAYLDAGENRLFLVELSAEGNFIGPITLPDSPIRIDQSTIQDVHIQSDDSLIVSTYQRGGDVSSARVTWFPSTAGILPTEIVHAFNFIPGIFVFPDDRILIGSQLYSPSGILLSNAPPFPSGSSPKTILPDGNLLLINTAHYPTIAFQKWHPDSGIDPTFGNNPTPSLITGFGPGFVIPAARNKLLVRTTINNNIYGSPSQLIRLHPNGQHDPTFRISQSPDSAFTEPASISLETPNGPTLWIGGSFTEINGRTQSSLAIIDDSSVSGFNSWMHASAQTHQYHLNDLLPNSDPDQDGATNLYEYAASTDPFHGSPAHSSPHKVAPLTFQVPCNPDAPEILREIEASTDLLHWLPAAANQVRLETSASCFTWTQRPNSPHTFTRLRILRPE